MSTPEAHPPTHVLADLAEGVLDDAQAGEVRAHVDQCATCQGTLAELAQVSVALRALPAELPVPEFVAARISHALAAERSSGGDAGGSDAAGSPDAGGGGTVAWFRRRLPQGLAAAASVAVIGFAGYIAVESGGGDDSSGAGDAAVAEGQAGDGDDEAGLEFGASSDTTSRRGSPSSTEPPVAADEPAAPEPIDPARLTAAVEDIVQDRTEYADSACGDDLAAELDLPLVGSTMVGAGVLIVLEDATTYDGWFLSTCNSTSNETLEPTVTVEKTE